MGATIGLRTVVARKVKPNGCAWCKDPIEVGEKYDRWMWKDGSDVAFMQVHSICFAIIELIREDKPAWDDEFPCERQDHTKGHGCFECDPLNERPAWESREPAAPPAEEKH